MSAEKNHKVTSQEYEAAAQLRDQEKNLQHQLTLEKTRWEADLKKKRYTVSEKHIANVIALTTGIPVQKIAQKERTQLLKMADVLKTKIIGQDEAIQKLVRTIQRTRVGFQDPKKPMGTFIFLGPTGVGKTALAKALAHYLFEKQEALIRIDMSEYMEKFSAARLIGAPPGYIGHESGGQLTEKVRRKPYSLILLDEMEKAHPDVYNLLLQVMDDGSLTDGLGRRVDFSNTIIIMTSNIGASAIHSSSIGFTTQEKHQDKVALQATFQKALKKNFRPEFLNRLDDTIIFNPLTKQNIHTIINHTLSTFYEKTQALGYHIQLSPQAKDFLCDKGYHQQYGVRPLQRAIQQYVEDPLVAQILQQDLATGAMIAVDYTKGAKSLHFNMKAPVVQP